MAGPSRLAGEGARRLATRRRRAWGLRFCPLEWGVRLRRCGRFPWWCGGRFSDCGEFLAVRGTTVSMATTDCLRWGEATSRGLGRSGRGQTCGRAGEALLRRGRRRGKLEYG